jgi:hypothetical protein
MSKPSKHKSPSPALAEEDYWEGEIVAQKGNKYQIKWKGVDPATGKDYQPTWVVPYPDTAITVGTEGELYCAAYSGLEE